MHITASLIKQCRHSHQRTKFIRISLVKGLRILGAFHFFGFLHKRSTATPASAEKHLSHFPHVPLHFSHLQPTHNKSRCVQSEIHSQEPNSHTLCTKKLEQQKRIISYNIIIHFIYCTQYHCPLIESSHTSRARTFFMSMSFYVHEYIIK